jgi:HK97 family phage major capsid protein
MSGAETRPQRLQNSEKLTTSIIRRIFHMKTITTTPRYNSTFASYIRGRAYNAADMTAVRAEDANGFFLPNESEALFRAEAEKMNIFRRIGRAVFTESGDIRIKAALPVGVAAYVDGGVAIPEADAAISAKVINAHKISKIIKISAEMAGDAGFDLEAAIAADVGREFGKIEEYGCVTGNGVNEPYGILHPTEGAEVGVTATGTSGIGYDDIIALYFSLGAEFRRNGSWLMNDSTALYLRTLKSADGQYLWSTANDTILGRPVYTSPHMPDISAGDQPVVFADFNFYWFLERGGVALRTLREKYAA